MYKYLIIVFEFWFGHFLFYFFNYNLMCCVSRLHPVFVFFTLSLLFIHKFF